ncbi:MAG TPA: hypothetical protein PLM53_12800 [Spirochaetota bacterium]|nr:hypothetical protein [Spirochaetota bacterium]HQF09412.1 hypothetical protein [Spirochaetota bacterium]HQH97974.1 hypothetical protein [Spirochaetota bacterium]
MNKQNSFNEFRDGRRDLFFIVTRDYDEELRERNMVFRKVDENSTSIIGFVTEEEAQSFLVKVMPDKNSWKVASINVMVFDDFLNSLDEKFRENLLFELI